jgi:hypothetical protein
MHAGSERRQEQRKGLARSKQPMLHAPLEGIRVVAVALCKKENQWGKESEQHLRCGVVDAGQQRVFKGDAAPSLVKERGAVRQQRMQRVRLCTAGQGPALDVSTSH